MDLVGEIDKFLVEKEEKKGVRDREYFYVSELGRTKKEIYESMKLKKKFIVNAQLARILENGNSMHERYTRMFAEMGILVAAEIAVVNEDFIHGRLDCLISDKKKNYIVELKSCNMWTFNKLKKPIHKDYLQIQYYMYYTNIKNGFVLYENKNDQSIKCYEVKLDKKLVEQINSDLKELKEKMDDGFIPEDEKISMEDLVYD